MMTLYTAVGSYRLTEKGLPVIMAGGRECTLDTHELLLWSILAFRILSYDELKAEFFEKERELHILGELDFDHYINRLINRRLIASGRDCTGVDALYDLMGHLHLQPISTCLAAKVITFLKLCLLKSFPLRQAAQVFQTEKLEPIEKQVISLIKDQSLSTAELIRCAEKGKKRLRSNQKLMECLYDDDTSDCETIVTESRFSEKQPSVLTAVANLYFKQHIIFDITL